MSRIKFEDFFQIFQDRVNKRLSTPDLRQYKYSDGIACLCASQNGSHVFMGAIDGALLAFDLSKEELTTLYKISGDDAEITSILVTNDDKYIVFASGSSSIGVYDWYENKIKYVFLQVHQDAISCLAITKDSEYIISGCRDGSIGFFDMEMETRIDLIPHAHEDVINSIALCSNDQYIVTASDDKSIRVFDFEKRRLLYVMEKAHQTGVTSLVVTNDSKYILSASNDSDKFLKMFDFKTRELVHTFADGDAAPITALTITKDDRYIIAGCLDRAIRIYDLQKRHYLFYFENIHDDPITTLAITGCKHSIISACYDGSFHVLDLRNKDLVHSYKEHQEKITSILATSDDKYLISASRDCNIHIFEISKREVSQTILKAHKAPITGLALSSDNNMLISVSRDKSIKFYNLTTFEEVNAIVDAHDDPITAVGLTSNNKYIITAAEDLSIKFFDFTTKACLHTILNAQDYPGSSIVITKDNKFMICESLDRSLHLFDIERKTKLFCFANKQLLTNLLVSPEIPLAISYDNTYVLFQLNPNSIGVYNFERKELASNFENCVEGVLTALAITHKYDYVITGSARGTLSILDITDGKKIYIIENAHACKITNILLIQNDKYIVSTDVEGTVNIFTNPLSTQEILALDTCLNTPASIFDLMVLNRFIVEENFPAKIEIIKKYPRLQIYPYRWNFFHLISKFYSRRDLVISCAQFELPLLIDSFNHTPLHYLLNKREIDYGLINGLLENYCDLILKHPNRDRIVQSLTIDLPSILRINTSEVAYFLRIGVGKPLTYGNEDIPHFGRLKHNIHSKFLVAKYQTFTPEIKAEILHPEEEEEGEESVDAKPMIAISVLKFFLNYDPHSKDMLRIIKALKRVTNEDIFKSQSASILTQYLWVKNRYVHYVLAVMFSILMILLSVYSAVNVKPLPFEVIILVLSLLFFFYEMFQLHFTPFKIYLTQIWNLFNVIFTTILSITIILQWISLSRYTKNVLISISLFFGYIKWISYFRVIDQTRKLIRMILEIIWAMRSFILILIFLVFGFALIFNQFDPSQTFGDHLLDIYIMIYANSDPTEFTPAQVAYYVIFTAILAIILLNMLIAIMTDTYDKVLEKSILAEGREKVSLILEATVLMRSLKKMCKKRQRMRKQLKNKTKQVRRKLRRSSEILDGELEQEKEERTSNKGYLFYVRKVEKDFDYISNFYELGWDFKKGRKIGTVTNNALTNERDLSEFAILRAQNNEIRMMLETKEARLNEMEKLVKTNFDELEKRLKVRMDEILTAVMEDNRSTQGSDIPLRYMKSARTFTKKITQKDVIE